MKRLTQIIGTGLLAIACSHPQIPQQQLLHVNAYIDPAGVHMYAMFPDHQLSFSSTTRDPEILLRTDTCDDRALQPYIIERFGLADTYDEVQDVYFRKKPKEGVKSPLTPEDIARLGC